MIFTNGVSYVYSYEQWKKPKVIKGNCLIILHSYMGIKTIHYKDPY